jgi:hypothetical protein
VDAGFSPYARHDGDSPSRLILFPHTSYESFCTPEWVGRETEWFRIANILHWSLSYLSHDDTERVLLIHPDSDLFAENLAVHTAAGRIITVAAETAYSAAQPVNSAELLTRLDEQPESSFDLILATGVFSRGASDRDEHALLHACRRVLKVDGALLATLPLRDDGGAPVTAANIQFLDAARQARFEEAEILGCQGIAEYLDRAFWDRLRSQGHAAFDAVLNALSPLTDSPATLWMSSEALYAGIKR